MIGDDIIVEVLGHYSDKVRISITAPQEVLIDHPKKLVKNTPSITYKSVNKLTGRE